jgi:hypothetical protein
LEALAQPRKWLEGDRYDSSADEMATTDIQAPGSAGIKMSPARFAAPAHRTRLIAAPSPWTHC